MAPAPPPLSGRLIVGSVLSLMLVGVGVAQVYLPFFSPEADSRRRAAGGSTTMADKKGGADLAAIRDHAKRMKEQQGGGGAPGSMWKNVKSHTKKEALEDSD